MSLLHVASYNIHRCVGTDGHYQPERIRSVLRELDARVIALQEVETGEQHGELLQFLVADSQWTVIEGPTLLRDTGQYGNALLTSLPIRRCELLDLSYKQREPRGAIDLTVDYENKAVRIIATHLGLLPDERRRQTRQLLDWMEHSQPTLADIIVLMGDLNEWFLWGRPLRWLRSWFSTTPAPATFPSRWPLFALDRIWVNPRARLVSTGTLRSRLSRQASDHVPVIATLNPHLSPG